MLANSSAWGNIVSVTGSLASSVGSVNPFRYRSYYYDTESGMYYLNARYYNPKLCRFISPDDINYANGDLLSYNLYAYCSNNPVMFSDPSGYFWEWLKDRAKDVLHLATKVKAVIDTPKTILKISAVSIVAVATEKATISDVWDDVKNFSFFNSDEEKVLKSNVFSSYNGTPVLKNDYLDIGSFSAFNTIVLRKKDVKLNNDGIETVRHEWGHTNQQTIMSPLKYLSRIGALSIAGYCIDPDNKTYYSLPWERSADLFGEVERSTGYYSNSDFWSTIYTFWP